MIANRFARDFMTAIYRKWLFAVCCAAPSQCRQVVAQACIAAAQTRIRAQKLPFPLRSTAGLPIRSENRPVSLLVD